MVYRTIARGPGETASTATSFYLQKREKRRCVSEASATPGDAPHPRDRSRRERRAVPRPTTATHMRPSSWAQPDAEQELVSTPPRSALGCASAAIDGPTTSD